ncbi:DUF7852 domain-containing protein [Clostridium arbusti]|uniref:DUF7852 domain-containing protein n=1 Tax=Clostridium arbusti TaxID=1137848 RepID=UPI00028804E0|nr:hypothetical protein [Clostridium arbusti]
MSRHRKHKKARYINPTYPMKLMFDKNLNYISMEKTENDFHKITLSSSESDHNTSAEFNIKDNETHPTTSKKKKIKHKNIEPKVRNSNVSSKTAPLLIPIKAPVIISNKKIDITIENKVSLNFYATAIKHINRKVSITQCTLIPKAKKLFLSGTITKSIEYSQLNTKNDSFDGRIKDITVHVPFDCVTDVNYIVDPDVQEKSSLNFVTLSKPGTKEETLSEAYTEVAPVYCEIVSIDFKELNIKEDIKPHVCKIPDVYIFKTITQKMVMYLNIRLIQNQKIFIKVQ